MSWNTSENTAGGERRGKEDGKDYIFEKTS
jgi:hypothetical protein